MCPSRFDRIPETSMKSILVTMATAAALSNAACSVPPSNTTLTIGTVNNGDMVRMQRLAGDFTASNPGITLNWVTLEENTLRQRLTQDIATRGGQFDVMTIGNYEAPIWARQKWLLPLDHLPADYDVADILPAIRSALSVEGTLYAVPFYAESAMVMYRTDLTRKAGITIGEEPTWTDIEAAARAITDRAHGTFGVCLRGKPGWGENMALITAIANSYGGRWFDMAWRPQFTTPAWRAALTTYLTLLREYGPPGAASNGFNENLSLFQQGRCGIWIDATVAASFLTDPDESTVSDRVGYATFPNTPGVSNHGNWLWAWNLAIPASTDAPEAAARFVAWATSRQYTQLVADRDGWRAVPPGTRASLYARPEYQQAAPFAAMTLKAIQAASSPLPEGRPYAGGQFVVIPEFQGIGTVVGQIFSAALAGQIDLEQALSQAQAATEREMKRAGYISN
jgi:sorbitol/mannitol transport system substrate-binding protein